MHKAAMNFLFSMYSNTHIEIFLLGVYAELKSLGNGVHKMRSFSRS